MYLGVLHESERPPGVVVGAETIVGEFLGVEHYLR